LERRSANCTRNFNVGPVVAPVGNNRFIVSILPGADSNATGDPSGSGQLAIVDVSDTANLKVTTAATVPQLDLIAVSGNTLYATTGAGLSSYRIGQ
jgi:hypothetical protein